MNGPYPWCDLIANEFTYTGFTHLIKIGRILTVYEAVAVVMTDDDMQISICIYTHIWLRRGLQITPERYNEEEEKG